MLQEQELPWQNA